MSIKFTTFKVSVYFQGNLRQVSRPSEVGNHKQRTLNELPDPKKRSENLEMI